MNQFNSFTGISRSGISDTRTIMFNSSRVLNAVAESSNCAFSYKEWSGRTIQWIVTASYATVDAAIRNFDSFVTISLSILEKGGREYIKTENLQSDRIVYCITSGTKTEILYEDENGSLVTYLADITYANMLTALNTVSESVTTGTFVTVNATTGNITTITSTTVNGTTVNSTDVNATTVSATTVGATQVNSTGVMTDSVKIGTELVTTPVGTVTVEEYGDGRDMTTVLTLTNFVVGAIPAANAALAVGNIVAAFPAGAHVESVYYKSIALKLPGDANAASVSGLGSVIGSGAVAVLNGTATFMDRSTEQTTPTAAAGGAVTTSLVKVTAGAYTGIGLNVAASVKNIFLNAAGTWVVNNAGNLTASGTIIFKWTKMS